MCDKAVDNYPHELEFVPECYKTKRMCDKIVSEDPFKLKYCHDRYNFQEMRNKAVDDFLPALKFVSDWFATSKIVKRLLTELYADDNILFFDEYAGDAIFCCNQMDILRVDLNDINLDDNYNEDDRKTIIHIRLLACHTKFEKRKALKKDINKKLMPVAWHPKRCWTFCVSEDEQKEIEAIFTK